MLERPFWTARLQSAWRSRGVVWLAGVRRVGKTSLVRMQPDATCLS